MRLKFALVGADWLNIVFLNQVTISFSVPFLTENYKYTIRKKGNASNYHV